MHPLSLGALAHTVTPRSKSFFSENCFILVAHVLLFHNPCSLLRSHFTPLSFHFHFLSLLCSSVLLTEHNIPVVFTQLLPLLLPTPHFLKPAIPKMFSNTSLQSNTSMISNSTTRFLMSNSTTFFSPPSTQSAVSSNSIYIYTVHTLTLILSFHSATSFIATLHALTPTLKICSNLTNITLQ